MKKETIISEDLQQQRLYADELVTSGFDFGLVLADAFVKGMRDIGYKNTGTALDELIDNSIQGEARSINVFLGFDGNSKKPTKLAVIDDGHGMDPVMIRAAMTWGGTHRQNDRKGFGRYGYGLPSSCVSMGKRYTVFSATKGAEWSKVTVDLAEIERHFTKGNVQRITVPEAESTDLPAWITAALGKQRIQLEHGTVVVIEEIDRLTYWTAQNLREFLLQHFGVTYRNYLRQIDLFVDGTKVEPIDPLFITPGFRYYDLDDDRAQAQEPLEIEVKGRETKAPIGVIKVRFAYMPPTFLRIPEDKKKGRGGKNNARFPIRKENNGIIVLRAGRQIDVISSKCPWTWFQNNDRYIGIEVDFPPVFDEEFSITTSKQQIVLSPRMWDILKENGVADAITQMRKEFEKDTKELKVEQDTPDPDEPRASEAAMAAAEKFLHRVPPTESSDERRESEANLDKEAERIAGETGLPKETVKQGLIGKALGRPFRVDFVNHPDAPFYSLERHGGQRVLRINKAHPFYTDFYAAADSSPTVRFRLEVLLFVLGDCELSATADEFKKFYKSERSEWSKNLRIVLEELSDWHTLADDAELNAEILESTGAQAEPATAG